MINIRSILALKSLAGFAQTGTFGRSLLFNNLCGLAFMQLFERNKKPAELSPIFKRETKLKGHLKSKSIKTYSKKLNTSVRKQKQKLKNHKGLLKRIKIVSLRLCRSVLGGIENSNSSHQAPTIFTGIRVAPI
jgi:hypothetical protein